MKRPAPPLEAAPLPADPPPEELVAGWVAPGLVAPGLVLVWASTGMVMKALATRQAAICFFSMIFLLISLGPIALPQRTRTTASPPDGSMEEGLSVLQLQALSPTELTPPPAARGRSR